MPVFVELAPDVWVNMGGGHVAMVRPSGDGGVAVVFPNGASERVAGTVAAVRAQLCGETGETT